MLCGTAGGKCLPSMVVYKAKNLYQGWVQSGLQDTIYDCTKSGWFDSGTLEICFFFSFSWKKWNKTQENLLSGDNLASHFNVNIVKAAEQNNVHFVMLPLNATHIL